MFGINGAQFYDSVAGIFLREYGAFFLAAVVCGLPVRDFLKARIHISENVLQVSGAVILVALMVVAVSYVAAGGYNPFIYFNF